MTKLTDSLNNHMYNLSQRFEIMNSLLLMLGLVFLAYCEEHMIAKYFQSKNINVLNLYLCKHDEAKELSRILVKNKNLMVNINIPNGKKTSFGVSLYVLQGFYIDLSCDENKKNLFEQSDITAFNDSFAWLMSADSSEILLELHALPLGVNSDVVLRLTNGSLYDVYKIAPRFSLTVNHCGVLNSSHFYLQKERRTSLEGVTLTGAIVIADLKVDDDFENLSRQFTDLTYYPEMEIFNREHFAIHQLLQVWLNYKLKHIRSTTWGYIDPQTGKMVGLVSDLTKGNADVALSPIQPRDDRWSEVHFLHALLKFRFIFVFRQPKVLGTSKALALPFSKEVWFYTFITMVLFTIVYEIIAFVGISISERNNLKNGEGFLYIIGIMTQQGLLKNPSICSMRILSLDLLLLALFVITYYNAAILNGLLKPAPNSIQNLKQLIKAKDIGTGVVNLSHVTTKVNWYLYFDQETRSKIEHTKNYIMSLKDGLERVRTERFALYADDNPLYLGISHMFTESEKCELSEVGGVPPFPLVLTVPKNSSLREIFNQGIAWLVENGLSERTKKRWYPNPPSCYGSITFVPLKLEAIVIALGIYLAGIIISAVIFAMEKLIHIRQQTVINLETKIKN